jgi:hypothetical protein
MSNDSRTLVELPVSARSSPLRRLIVQLSGAIMEQQFGDGMTVNERLYHFGLMPEFDVAARARNVPAMEKVLLQARFSMTQAKETALAVAANPERFGY